MILSSTNLNEIEAKRTSQEFFDGNKNESAHYIDTWTQYQTITFILSLNNVHNYTCTVLVLHCTLNWTLILMDRTPLWNRAWSLQSWQHTSSTLTSLLTSSFWIPWLGFVDAGIWRSTLAASAHICRIINQFWKFPIWKIEHSKIFQKLLHCSSQENLFQQIIFWKFQHF
jgi:hypothetical protein